MSKHKSLFIQRTLSLAFVFAFAAPLFAQAPPRLSRADSYFGVHFDFHAELDDPEIGGATTREMVNALIDATDPDYFEIDTKGHPGVSSYPTKVGNSAGRFVGDPLKIWREATADRGVALYGHHSGVWDRRACQLHPDWQAQNPDGSFIGEKASIVGPYVDSLFVPQLLELANDYELDGAWVDGDVWGLVVDWSPALCERFTKETGIEKAPTDPSDPNWKTWRNFQREAFREYVKRYCRKVKEDSPNFQICCNWAFSAHMPEPPFEGIDFISGDLCGYNCVDVARYNSRLFASQGVPWDLMSWSFHDWKLRVLDDPKSRKPAIQLMREAACVIPQGGGYQAVFSQAPAGYPPKRDGSVDVEKVKLFKEVAEFCRARQEFCFKSQFVPQIAVLLSTQGTYDRWDVNNAGLFWWDHRQEGVVSCLLDNQQAVSVLVTRRLLERLNEFPLVVACEWDSLEEELKTRLVDYVKTGGKLFIVGENTKALFNAALDEAQKEDARKLGTDAPEGFSVEFYALGKGRIATVDRPFSEAYMGDPKPELRDFVGAVVNELFPDPIVKVEGSREIDVSLARDVAGELVVGLTNVSGPHRTAGVIDRIDPIRNVQVAIRTAAKPKKVLLQPGAREVDWTWKDGAVQLTVESVPICELVVVTE